MMPTLETDDILLVNKFSKRVSQNLQNGNLYIFVSPTDPEKLICKRVVARVHRKRNYEL